MELTVNNEIILREASLEDAGEIYALVDKNRAHLSTFLAWVDFTESALDTRSFLETIEPLPFKILFRGDFVGLVGLSKIDTLNMTAEIGYWLDQESEGKGIMTQSVKALVEHAFQDLHLHRLEINCAVSNHRSFAIPERLGFEKEGLKRESIFVQGLYLDAFLYSNISFN